jgi:hydrogenase/urease accessory protein HupE
MRFLLAGMVLAATSLEAHEVRPLVVTVRALEDHRYGYEMRVPDSILGAARPQLEWPVDCAAVSLHVVRCREQMAGRTLRILWPDSDPAIATLARYTDVLGKTDTQVLAPQVSQWTVSGGAMVHTARRNYFELGVAHILGGWDHLLFLCGLLLIARSAWRICIAVTGFTLAHSFTLGLASLGWLRVPVPPTEVVIALSIILVARAILSQRRDTLLRRYPVAVSSAFGLLHGLGFAAALAQAQIPRSELLPAVLFFNLGVEVGQAAFILALVAAVALLARLFSGELQRTPARVPAMKRTAAYLIGIPATFWLLGRLPWP